jgi:hypothetical protein
MLVDYYSLSQYLLQLLNCNRINLYKVGLGVFTADQYVHPYYSITYHTSIEDHHHTIS